MIDEHLLLPSVVVEGLWNPLTIPILFYSYWHDAFDSILGMRRCILIVLV